MFIPKLPYASPYYNRQDEHALAPTGHGNGLRRKRERLGAYTTPAYKIEGIDGPLALHLSPPMDNSQRVQIMQYALQRVAWAEAVNNHAAETYTPNCNPVRCLSARRNRF